MKLILEPVCHAPRNATIPMPLAARDVQECVCHVCVCAYEHNNRPIISVSLCARVLRVPLLIAAIVARSDIPMSAKLMPYILDQSLMDR